MTTKEIIIANINAINFVAGNSIRSKGLELFTSNKQLFADYPYDGFDAERATKAIESINKKLEGKELSRVAISIRKHGEKPQALALADLNVDSLLGFNEIIVTLKGALVGYLNVSKYDASKVDQQKLIEDVYKLAGYSIGGEWLDSSYDEFEDIMYFKYHANGCYNGDYSLVHGAQTTSPTGDCTKIDGRMHFYNDSVVDGFWFDGLECEKEYFKSIDPEEQISVFHRKGKDWYFGYSLEEKEIYINFKDEDGEVIEEEYFKVLIWKENKELLEKFVESFKATKKDLDVKGYIFNELDYDRCDTYTRNNLDGIFNLELIDTYSNEDRQEFAYELIDLVDYDSINDTWRDAKNAVKLAYDKFLEQQIVGKDDNGVYDEFKALVGEIGYELTETVVPGTNYKQSCVKYKNEEYHFFLGELFNSSSARDFFTKVQVALQKRILEKVEESALMEKAKFVFVGLQDSYNAGNCQSGTEAFCNRNHIDTKNIGAIRGDEVLRMEVSNFTKRAVFAALKRYGKDVA